MKKMTLDIIMAAGIAAALLLSGFRGFAAECERVQNEVLRLHIPANSDSERDQEIKLRLRDYILKQYGTRLSCENDIEQAIAQTKALLPEIEADCNEFLANEGVNYTAKAELTEMYFTTRTYEEVTLPAGTYTALRITLGSGEGKNWWCVMFPPLCIPTACVQPTNQIPDVMVNANQNEGVKIEFALFEFVKWLLGGCK